MIRAALFVTVVAIAATLWVASCIRSAEADYVQVQRGVPK
jgi:hypothetical protein